MEDLSGALVETHVSWVFLVGERAYKVKKPVHNGFLDFSTVEARQGACDDEVRINRRLAPDVYLGVDTVIDGGGRPVESMVVMRRMPAERRLSTMVDRGEDVDGAVRAVAHQIATLHLSGSRSAVADAAASAGSTLARWEANDAEIVPLAHLLAHPELPTRLVDQAATYLRGRTRLFDERVREGRAGDGHGDLSPDDIFVLDDGPRILDALEFDEQLRLGDGLADIAFLAMHLERLGAPALAGRLLGWYREFAADDWPDSLAHHHIAYRAQVRAKVALLRAAQSGATNAPEADGLLALAADHLDAGRVRLVLVGGSPGTGKSTVAAAIADAHGWVLLRSDEVRKELAGLAATSRTNDGPDAGVYGATMTALTYGELLHRAESLADVGESVVVDATWADPVWRDAAVRTARLAGAELVSLRCVAPLDLAQQRAADRLDRGDDPSDASPEIVRLVRDRFAAWPEAVEIDTAGDLGIALGQVEYRLGSERSRSSVTAS